MTATAATAKQGPIQVGSSGDYPCWEGAGTPVSVLSAMLAIPTCWHCGWLSSHAASSPGISTVFSGAQRLPACWYGRVVHILQPDLSDTASFGRVTELLACPAAYHRHEMDTMQSARGAWHGSAGYKTAVTGAVEVHFRGG